MGEPPAGKHLPPLPVELWLKVFRWATLDPWTHVLYATDYYPFHSVVPPIANDNAANKTKQVLPLVCKDWRRWATPLLYEDILINSSYSSLAHALKHGRDWGDGSSMPPCGPLVRRARLPYSSTTTSAMNSSLRGLRVLRLCPGLHVLVRPPAMGLPILFQFPAQPDACPPLPALRRLDWWHHNEATRTGGVNTLPHVLALAPALTYLSVAGSLWASYAAAAPVPVCLPHLATLRLWQVDAVSVLQLARWTLPALRHAVLDHVTHAHAGALDTLWDAFGAQLRVIELGVSVGFLAADVLTDVLAGCPRLEELYYSVQFTLPPLWTAVAEDEDGGGGRVRCAMEFLGTVGLHAHPNKMFTVGSAGYWLHLGRHFEALCRPTFPALRRVVLYGDWSAVVGDDQFIGVTEPLRTKGCSVEMAMV